ncbi:hypothetical protein PSM7751_03300 [Pseudooceanicola marinus]|uniref:DUF4864 domain-containing protein n=1 Tax=Pseudooceanicola marinus TaxID=396013 RepID=A0A1X6ZXV3_9RHOB|nr:DUF4864 domain-containing protein [Pseudooceanicola marinus]PJE30047.1 DUF4864 domain-containing protein [Pseudooceanicola marinus]SLN64785.1 hypothetical protein PSM7751_03300 [Pseudooceanicola marinus]
MRTLAAILTALSLTITLALPAQASQDIRDIIGDQMEDLRRGDFASAFDHASPGIRNYFGSVENFETMLRGGYPMVIGPREYFFLADRPETEQRQVQPVQVEDQGGRLFTLEYFMLRTDTGWKIDAVRLMDVAKPSV